MGYDSAIGWTQATWNPWYNCRSDADNLIASLKKALDGIALAMKVDDSCFQIGEVSWQKGKAATILTVSEAV